MSVGPTGPVNVNTPPDPSPIAIAVAPVPTPAEDGSTTSEFGLVKLAVAAVGVANGALGVAAAFGVPITGPEIAAIAGFEGSVVGLVGAYAVSRGIRKRGTPG